MKKFHITSLHTIIKVLVSFYVIADIAINIDPFFGAVNFFNKSWDTLFVYDVIATKIIAVVATINILYAGKKNNWRWLLVTPVIILVLQILLMFFFKARQLPGQGDPRTYIP